MKALLNELFQGKILSEDEAKAALLQISNGLENEFQMASFLTVYRMRDITTAELNGFRKALLQLANPYKANADSLDIVGTGGDGKNTFNISTTSAFVIAGAGYKVTKHGNNSVSSNCGSSNLLQAVGYEFTNDSDRLNATLDSADLCFLHAPLFHPAMRHVSNVRKQLGVKTFFNMLGPLVNPTQPRYNIFGVYEASLGTKYQSILKAANRKFKVIYDQNGYDEVSLTGTVSVWDEKGHQSLNPSDFGLPACAPADLYGGETVDDAKQIFLDILEGKSTEAQKNVVLANAGLAIQCMNPDRSLVDCVAEASASLADKKALKALELLTRK